MILGKLGIELNLIVPRTRRDRHDHTQTTSVIDEGGIDVEWLDVWKFDGSILRYRMDGLKVLYDGWNVLYYG